MIQQIKEQFAEELDRRRAEGRDYPAFFGDIKLTRALRGCDGDVEKAMEWFGNYIVKFNELDIDARIPHLPDVTVGGGCGTVDLASASGGKVLKHINVLWNAQRLTPKGDVICYSALSNYSAHKIVEEDLLGEVMNFELTNMLSRDLHLDHLSRMQNRIAKVVWIVDFTGASWSQLFSWRLIKHYSDNITPIQIALTIEHIQATVIVNSPRWHKSMWEKLKGLCPENTQRRIVFLGPEWTTDPTLLHYVGADQLASLIATRQCGAEVAGDENSGTAAIVAGRVFERIFQATPGQLYAWTFKVEAGALIMDSSDIEFSVIMMADSAVDEALMEDSGEDKAVGDNQRKSKQQLWKQHTKESAFNAACQEPFVCRPQKVTDRDGSVSGEYDVTTPGMLIIRWSNSHSWVRARSVQFHITMSENAPCSPSSLEGFLEEEVLQI